jgi:hypothetical protein
LMCFFIAWCSQHEQGSTAGLLILISVIKIWNNLFSGDL